MARPTSAQDRGSAGTTSPTLKVSPKKRASCLRINLYTTPTCPYSRMAKAWLDQNKVSYHEYDVTIDETAKKRIIAKSGRQSVPQIEIGNVVIVGFDRESIEKRLGKKIE
ncbi:MAG: glutaredoxin domain-containing protein [Nanoarchaeota archaeon]|mgnify:CR=1 FL=1